MIGDSVLIKKEEKTNSNKIEKFIILEFTKELIRNYSPEQMINLAGSLEEERKIKSRHEKTKSKVKEIMEFREKETEKLPEDMVPSILEGKNLFFSVPARKEPKSFENYRSILDLMPQVAAFERKSIIRTDPFRELKLIIPETRFPPHLQYIKPVPLNKEIDLGKLNPLIEDVFVKVIECYGADQNIIIRGNVEARKTTIILKKEEIDEIIKKFSLETRIPVHEGIFKVVAGRLIFLAIVSEILGSKFIIRKMLPEEAERYTIYR